MEKLYIAPELEVLKVDLLEDVLVGGASTEPSVPIETASEEVGPDVPSMPDF
ncbi:MAG: hypothetical protein IJ932_06225 [Ruminococcus sp.]|nr:hypothetical protein [Ruminococcus sp.]